MASAMATRAAEMQQLVDSLGSSVKSSSKTRYDRIRQNALAAARSTTHPRTDQFAVRDQLAGLQEKAEILHRSDVAEALGSAVTRANDISSKWMPECLSLLLQISDRPIDKTNLADLEVLRGSGQDGPLTWEDILRDDPYESDESIWNNVDFAAESSEDGDEISLIHSDGPSDFEPSVVEDTRDALHETYLEAQLSILDPVESWRAQVRLYEDSGGQRTLRVAESQLIRLTLFTLGGMPTELFRYDDGRWAPNEGICVEGPSKDALYSILGQFSSLATELSKLRAWSMKKALQPIEQTFQAMLQRALNAFDATLSKLEQRVLRPSEVPTTLLALMPDVRDAFQDLAFYARILKQQDGQRASPFDYIDSLHNELCYQQSLGNKGAFVTTLPAFEQCLHTFLKPVAAWLYDGDLVAGGLSFLAKNNNKDVTPANFWSENFKLVVDSTGEPRAPVVFRPFVNKVVGIGKTIVFLRMLGESIPRSTTQAILPNLSGASVRSSILAPFQESLTEALDDWISSSQLRLEHSISHVLQSEGGLGDVIDALEQVYYGRNGACFDQVATRLSERLRQANQGFSNSYMITGIYQDAYSECKNIKTGLISVRLSLAQGQKNTKDPLAILDSIDVFYSLPWAISNILEPESLEGYRRIHRLLLQLRIAKYAVDQDFGLGRTAGGRNCARPQALFLSLRHRLRCFLNTLSSYLLGTALQVTHRQLREVVEFTGELDDLIELHSKVIGTALKRCILYWADSSTLKALLSMLRLAMMFPSAVSAAGRNEVSHQQPVDEDTDKTSGELAPTAVSFDEARLEELSATYFQLHSFIQAGVLDLSRTEGDRYLQILAHDLSTDGPWTEI